MIATCFGVDEADIFMCLVSPYQDYQPECSSIQSFASRLIRLERGNFEGLQKTSKEPLSQQCDETNDSEKSGVLQAIYAPESFMALRWQNDVGGSLFPLSALFICLWKTVYANGKTVKKILDECKNHSFSNERNTTSTFPA